MHLVWQVEPAHALGHFRLQLGSEDLVPLALGHHHPRTLARVRFGVRAGVRVRIRVRVRVRVRGRLSLSLSLSLALTLTRMNGSCTGRLCRECNVSDDHSKPGVVARLHIG